VLHVPGLVVPLYSLRAHIKQRGCGFIGTSDVGILVYFPTFVLSVDTSKDCHLAYELLGRSAPIDTLHYVRPRCELSLYPLEIASHGAVQTPILIDNNSSAEGLIDSDRSQVWPVSPPSPLRQDFDSVSAQLCSLADAVASLLPSCPPSTDSVPSSLPDAMPAPVDPLPSPVLLSTMTRDKIVSLVHHPNSTLPPVCPCDTANASDSKTHWSAEELHQTMGCRKFCNYKHLLQVSSGGQWIDGGEFPPSLGSFATIPKAKRGQPLDQTVYRFLNAVYMDIAFGDCLSIGGFCYAFILVDCAMRYNWTFGLKTLSSDCILRALRLSQSLAGSLACCFYCNCNTKLVGTGVSEYLIDNNSRVVTAPAKRQSLNGLVESHWKTMVYMACAYLTEKQMPRSFWFYAITHAAQMMNAIPGKIQDTPCITILTCSWRWP
jgi:hypothetical protein